MGKGISDYVSALWMMGPGEVIASDGEERAGQTPSILTC